jgi:MFS family permease
MTLTIVVLMVAVTGRVVARFGFKRPVIAGLVTLAAGITWLSLAPAGGSYLSTILPATLVAATGMSLAYIPTMLAALSGARPEEGGLAAGIVNTTYQAGSALGLAAVTAVATASGFGGAPAAGFGAAFIGAAVVALVGAAVAALALRGPAREPAAEAAPSGAVEAAPSGQPQFAD